MSGWIFLNFNHKVLGSLNNRRKKKVFALEVSYSPINLSFEILKRPQTGGKICDFSYVSDVQTSSADLIFCERFLGFFNHKVLGSLNNGRKKKVFALEVSYSPINLSFEILKRPQTGGKICDFSGVFRIVITMGFENFSHLKL